MIWLLWSTNNWIEWPLRKIWSIAMHWVSPQIVGWNGKLHVLNLGANKSALMSSTPALPLRPTYSLTLSTLLYTFQLALSLVVVSFPGVPHAFFLLSPSHPLNLHLILISWGKAYPKTLICIVMASWYPPHFKHPSYSLMSNVQLIFVSSSTSHTT